MFAGYNAWCNERLYAAAAAVRDADYRADRGAFFKSLHGTSNHLLVGDRIWMRRFTGDGRIAAEPRRHPLRRLRGLARRARRARTRASPAISRRSSDSRSRRHRSATAPSCGRPRSSRRWRRRSTISSITRPTTAARRTPCSRPSSATTRRRPSISSSISARPGKAACADRLTRRDCVVARRVGQKARHARHRRPHRPHCRPRAAGRRLRPHHARRPRRPGRPQRLRQDHAVQRDRRRPLAPSTAASSCRRAGASGGWRRKRRTARRACSRSCSQADRERNALAGRGGDRARPASHRRDPDPARRHRRACGPGARRRDPVRPRLFQRRPGAALFGILRRLAHARRARRHAVRRARPADAGRADQLSRSRRHALAAGSPGALSAHHDHHQPRPRSPGQRGRPDPVAGSAASSRSIAAAIATSSACAASAWCSTRR